MLLCTWISNCPIAVTHFLHNQENVPFVSLKSLAAMSDVYEEKCLHLVIVALKITLSCKCAFQVLIRNLNLNEMNRGRRHLFLTTCMWVSRIMKEWILDFGTSPADGTDLRELGRRWEAGPGSVRTAARHLHLLQWQLAGELHQVSLSELTHLHDIIINIITVVHIYQVHRADVN